MAAKKKPGQQPVARDKLDAIGIEAICERMMAGETMTGIAESIGVSKGSMIAWIASDADRSAHAKEARIVSARHWDDQAERVLLDSDELVTGSIAKARELASHYRWRAKCYAPRDYGDKIAIDAEVKVSDATDEQLNARLIELAGKAGIAGLAGGKGEKE